MSTPRYRTTGELTTLGSVQTWDQWQSCAQSAWTVTGTYPGGFVGETKLMYDYVTDNFQKRIQRGEVIFNPMYSEHRSVSSGGGHGVEIKAKLYPRVPCNEYYRFRITGDHFARRRSLTATSCIPSQLILAEDVNDLAAELSTCVHAKRGRSDSNLWESMAELHKSARILTSLGQRALNLTGLLGSKPQASQASKEWLTYRYGIKPIIRDVESVMNALRKSVRAVRHTSRCSGELSEERTDYATDAHNSVVDSYYILRKDVVSLRAMSLDEWSASFMTDAGFSSKGLWTLPWELTPYSFVADWFFNIGDYLNAIAPSFGTKQLGSALVEERVVSANFVCTGTTSASYDVTSQTTGSVTTTVKSKSRAGLPPASLVTKRDFRLRTLTRAADAMALVGVLLLQKGK